MAFRSVAPADRSPKRSGTTLWKPLLVGIGLTSLINLWVLQAELVSGSAYISAGTPPVTAIFAVVLVALLVPFLARLHPRLALSRVQVLLVYIFLTFSVPFASFGGVRAFFPCLTALGYFATPGNQFERYWSYLPAWLVPKQPDLIRQYYEGSDDGRVPWAAWAEPLLLWALFFLALFFTVLGLMMLLRRQWIAVERLTFPLLYLPLQITAGLGRGPTGDASPVALFFRNPLMWLGFSVGFLYNLSNILHAFNPAVPAIPPWYNLGQIFTEKPLDALQPLTFDLMPHAIGLGYLMPLEIAFSVWVFYFALKALNVTARIVGYERAGFPFYHAQSEGAYLALGLVLLWMARRSLGAGRKGNEGTEGERGGAKWWEGGVVGTASPANLSCGFCLERWAGSIFALGLASLLVWSVQAGMSLSLATLYFVVILLFVLVYARIRAEAGPPFVWLYPYGGQKDVLTNVLGSPGLLAVGGVRSLTLLSTFSWLARHYLPVGMGAYTMDGFKLAQETNESPHRLSLALALAVLVGFACASWSHLSAYYRYGANIVEGASGLADYRTAVAVDDYATMSRAVQQPTPPDLLKVMFTALGFGVAVGLSFLRFRFLRFPLHPLGYVIGTAYESHSPYWGPFFLVWLLKLTILRLGGARLYKQLIPAFLGLALGHFLVAGVGWGTLSLFINPDVARRYRAAFD